MNLKASIRPLLLLATGLLLSACGGGGGSDNDSGFNPTGIRISAAPTSVTMNTVSANTITVRVTEANGQAVPDGTTVTGNVTPAGAGNIAALGSTGSSGASASGSTSGGSVTFLFQSGGQPGSATLRFSAQDPNTPSRTATTTVPVTINSGPGSDPRISFQPTKTQIPVNSQLIDFFIGSPFIAEVIVNARSATGQPIQDDGDGDQAIQFTVSPAECGAVSVPDDPETTDINELTTPWISIFTGVASGVARAFVWSSDEVCPVTLTASFTDPDTGQRVEGSITFNIVSSAPALPASVTVFPPVNPIYIRDSGGNQSSVFQVFVADGNGSGVPDPRSGNTAWNNVSVEIVAGPANADATLSGTNAAGQLVSGQQISLATTDGIATPTLRAGNTPGSYTIRATADAADNNVDNGIQDPVHGTFTIIVGDGRLFSIELTIPGDETVTENRIIEFDGEGNGVDQGPDGTYSVTISAIATDRQGNPVLPGTPINFGLIDSPQTGFPANGGGFDLSGPDGNPQEAGTLFTAPSGQFLTAGGGAGPGDTLVLFAEDVVGNRDHEAARTVDSINSQTSLNVTRRFNRNDDTGFIVDSGPIIPYAIGRATSATIPASATTNELGIATTRYTYPVSQLGRPVIIWAQGEGDVINNVAETVADVEVYAFFGIAPATLVVSPNPIPGNRTVEIQACVFDDNLNAVQGVPVSFQFSGLSGGTGSIDGVSNVGVMPNRTGVDGCATGTLVTSGVSPAGDPQVVFSAVGESVEVPIIVNASLLTATPTFVAVPDSGTEATIALLLTDDQGEGVPGVAIGITCGDNLEIIIEPGVTNNDGRTGARVRACGFAPGDTSTCVYTAETGQQASTQFAGGGAGTSPPFTGCAP